MQATDMSNAELLQYKQYLQKYVFTGWQAPDDLKEWVRMLENHISHSDMASEDQLDAMLSDDLPEIISETKQASKCQHASQAPVCCAC